VFAPRASEGVATDGRIGVLVVLVNGTVVLGKYLIRLVFSKVFPVRLSDSAMTLSDATAIRNRAFCEVWRQFVRDF
jgi:hypothetical protein